MTVAETRQFIGDSFPVKYYTQSGYVDATAHYDSSYTAGGYSETSESPLGFMVGNGSVSWLFYTVSASGVNTTPTEVTCQLQPTYSIFDTEYIYTCFALSSGANAYAVPSSSTYNSPTSNWYVGGSVNNFRNSAESASGSGLHSYLNLGYSMRFTYIPIVASSQSAFSAYSMDCNFYGNSTSYNSYIFAVMCPYVSGSAVGGSGVFTTASGSGSGDVNVNVDIDMDETNGLLEDIKDGISGIGDTILGLFVPDEQFMEDWKDDMQDLLEDHLGGLYEAVATLDDFWDQFQNIQTKQEIYIPACHIPLAGTDFVLGDWHVPLKPAGIPQILYTSLALIVDFLAIMSFLKMCRNKLEIFLNPDSEVVESDH